MIGRRALLQGLKERAGALVVLSSPVFNAARRQFATLTGRSRLPSIMAFPGYAEDGGLIGYGPQLHSMFAQAAVTWCGCSRALRRARSRWSGRSSSRG